MTKQDNKKRAIIVALCIIWVPPLLVVALRDRVIVTSTTKTESRLETVSMELQPLS